MVEKRTGGGRMAEQGKSITDVLDTLCETASGGETSVDDVLNAFGRRAYGPILFVVGVVSLSPVGAIPGASILFGSLVALLMIQYILRDDPPWIPHWIRDRSVPGDRAAKAVGKVKPYFEKLETFIRPRGHALVQPPWTYIAAAVCIGLSLTMYPLALVPWGVMPPSLALALFGLGMMSADGLLIGIGLALSCGAFALTVWIW